MHKYIVSHLYYHVGVIIFIAGISCMGCDMPTTIADEIASGPSTISVKINGVARTFEATGSRGMNGVYLQGISGEDKISIHLYTTFNGVYSWSGQPMTSLSGSSEAQFNDANALKNQGSLHIIENDVDCVYGTFDFKALNSITKDTIYFTEGSFKVRYLNTEE